MGFFNEEIKKEPIWQQVVESLRRKIILGDIKEGEHLKESILSEEFGVSRWPIREAISLLEKEGLVHTPNNGRSIVIGFSEENLEDLYFVRKLIETSAIDLISFPLNKEVMEKITKIVEKMDELDSNQEKINSLDLQYHYLIICQSNNRTLIQTWLSINGIVKTLMGITNLYAMGENKFTKHHREIIEALDLQDKKKVKQIIAEHFDYGVSIMKKYI